MSERTVVLVLFGGRSEEHDVSIRSAVQVVGAIDLERYEPVCVGITQTGAWLWCERPGEGWSEGPCRPALLSPDAQAHALLVREQGRWDPVSVDVAFPVLHGKNGEDGAVQGLLELSGVPYVGCDVAGSVLCMDKSLAYVVASSAGIATPEHRVVTGSDLPAPDALPYPVFVKPARSGSSFGVTRVEAGDGLAAAIAEARRFDDKVLVEQAVVGTEVGCAVLGDGDELLVGEVDQITLSHGLFRIHQEDDPERGSENATVTVPADLPASDRARVQEVAQATYRALGCRGLARVDTFLQDDGRVVLNEVNTMPGFTSYSRYPRMMAAAGLSLAEVVDRSLSLALGR